MAALTLPMLGFYGANEPTIQCVSELIPPRSGSTDCTFYFGPVPVSDRCGFRFKISVGKFIYDNLSRWLRYVFQVPVVAFLVQSQCTNVQ